MGYPQKNIPITIYILLALLALVWGLLVLDPTTLISMRSPNAITMLPNETSEFLWGMLTAVAAACVALGAWRHHRRLLRLGLFAMFIWRSTQFVMVAVLTNWRAASVPDLAGWVILIGYVYLNVKE